MTALTELFSSKYTNEKYHKILIEPIVYAFESPGSSLWPKFMRALNFWMRVPKDKFEKITNIIHLIRVNHSVIGEVGENSLIRNGAATSNSVYGSGETLNSAYYCSFIIFEKIIELGSIEAVNSTNDFMTEWSKGVGTEIYWRDNIICPNEDEYIKIISYKTESLMIYTIKLLQLFSADQTNYDNLVPILAKFFHIYDDYACLHLMKDYFLNGIGYDVVSEGKFSFPLIYAIRNCPEDAQILNILRQKPTDLDVIKYLVSLAEKYDGFKHCTETLSKLKIQAEEEMSKLDENPYLVQIFETISAKLNLEE